ncbi:MAG: hypothetical protein P4L84_00440 [Isosphaeraceae bacterium]|nr:hypothetical protein [Isosphaeraceae bacterium]
MKRPGSWLRLGLAVLVTAGGAWCAARAQNYLGQIEAPPLPLAPPQGAWGEVIMANAKWLVVQNHSGQQFPVRFDQINQFLVRWPTDPSNLTNASVVEAIGSDVGSNVLRTEHVDVFEGSDRGLVAPTYRSVLPNNRVVTTIDPTFNRMMNAWDIEGQANLYGWAYPISPANLAVGGRLHVVGNVVAVNPALQIGVPGNNFATILPGASSSIQMTQVTLGTWSFLEKGDLVFLTPSGVAPETLVLQQLVLYKKIPRNRFGN